MCRYIRVISFIVAELHNPFIGLLILGFHPFPFLSDLTDHMSCTIMKLFDVTLYIEIKIIVGTFKVTNLRLISVECQYKKI